MKDLIYRSHNAQDSYNKVKEKYGLRLPPERHCLTAVNFQLIPEVNSY